MATAKKAPAKKAPIKKAPAKKAAKKTAKKAAKKSAPGAPLSLDLIYPKPAAQPTPPKPKR